jgi:hypothetical protein
VVCAFDQKTGRWTVDLGADGAKPACRGMFRSANLRLIPSHNFSMEWVDESGRVLPKKVIFSRQCAKGHALSPLRERDGFSCKRLMCRLCHCICERGCDEASNWMMCSEDVGCCGEYAVCCSCSLLSGIADAECAGSDDFNTQVSCRAAFVCMRSDVFDCRAWRCGTCRGCGRRWAGRWAACRRHNFASCTCARSRGAATAA